jgi:aspartate kinase
MKNFSVAKFGGTSLADTAIILRSVDALMLNPDIRVCVISATAGTTNQLQRMAQAFSQKNRTDGEKLYLDFSSRHLRLAKELGITEKDFSFYKNGLERVKELCEGFLLLGHVPALSLDEFLSWGELLSSKLFELALRQKNISCVWLDARELMKTNGEFGKARPHLDLLREKSQTHIYPLIEKNIVVTQGYIGSDLNGQTTTLGKEGSDFSTALFAEALNAQKIYIWKDVQGIMTTDPRLLSEAQVLKQIHVDEIRELTRFGAKVIHPDTFTPALRAHIPIQVGYSQNPSLPGTLIISSPENRQKNKLTAISLKKSVICLELTFKEAQTNIEQFMSSLTQVLREQRIEPLIYNQSGRFVQLVLESGTKPHADFFKHLEVQCDVDLEDNKDLITLVKKDLFVHPNFSALFRNITTPLKFFSGHSPHSLSFLVAPENTPPLLHVLHPLTSEIPV